MLAAIPWEPGVHQVAVVLSGDVDCDGVRTSIDAALVLQLDGGLVDSLACEDKGDVDGDGIVNSVDASLILQFAAGLMG